MSELIQPIVDRFVAILRGIEDPKFVSVQQLGVQPNLPCAQVVAVRTTFPDGGEGTARNQIHQITVRLGIGGGEPDALAKKCTRAVQLVDAAINGAEDWPDYVLQVFVAEHDFGPLYKQVGGTLAYWPEIHCLVTVEEEE